MWVADQAGDFALSGQLANDIDAWDYDEQPWYVTTTKASIRCWYRRPTYGLRDTSPSFASHYIFCRTPSDSAAN
jgi:hypothetical protein